MVRENPNVRGFLVLGTDAGLYYSPDGGLRWTALRDSFPTVPVWDVLFVARSHDLVVATHGQGLFVLDNLTPLEEVTPAARAADLHLFAMRPAMLWVRGRADPPPASRFLAPNAPRGAMVDYYLRAELKVSDDDKHAHKTPVAITVTDTAGDTVVTAYGPSKQGFNPVRLGPPVRGAWPRALTFEKPVDQEEENVSPLRGPSVPPGRYRVSVTAAGRTETEAVTVEPDPHVSTPTEFGFATRRRLEVRNALSAEHVLL